MLRMSLIIALLCVAPTPAGIAAEAPAVVSQNLTAAAASTKVAAVIWTRRTDRYTLQIVLPRWNEGMTVVDGRIEAPNATPPDVTVWLLRADGTAIPTTRDAPLRGAASGAATAPPAEIAYSVGLAAGASAVAAAIRIDDEYYIERLQPLAGR